MKELVKLISHDLKYEKKFLVNMIIVAIVSIACSIISIGNFSLSIFLMPYLEVMLIVFFIYDIVIFCKNLSKESGNFLFLAPIKGKQYILATYIEYLLRTIILNLIVIGSVFLFNNNALNVKVYIITGIATMFGLLICLIFITCGIVICSSFISINGLNIACCIVFPMIIFSVIGLFQKIFMYIPYIYLNVNGIEVNLCFSILSLAFIVYLILFSAKLIDKKLDIN